MRTAGIAMMCIGLGVFSILPFFSSYRPDAPTIERHLSKPGLETLSAKLTDGLAGKTYAFATEISGEIAEAIEDHNRLMRSKEEWESMIYDDPKTLSAAIAADAIQGYVVTYSSLFFALTFGLAILGGLIFIIATADLKLPAGIRNNDVYKAPATARGWVAWLVFPWLITFYVILYFYPELAVSWSVLTDPISSALSGNPGGRWFLYGFMYTTVMVVMGVRMFIKYRGVPYQLVRTASVLFFQIGFAFLIPEVLGRFNMPRQDFKNIWPLDYSFFFSWRIDEMISNGTFGWFILIWGLVLIVVGVPVMVYFFGKRWYCSWVCGCGGLAETLGDPYRQHSDKSLASWKFERWVIHLVLVFAFAMTLLTLYTFFTGQSRILFIDTYAIQRAYGFAIGAVFAGVIGTGFYPLLGSRVWCRFGCPLAAYLGFVQRFKSRFRITTNGGQCISCGNCSTYCEMGIDVRWYAQRGQNIVRSSCVGCGICSAVCPRGVLKLENSTSSRRLNDNPIIIGREGVQLSENLLK